MTECLHATTGGESGNSWFAHLAVNQPFDVSSARRVIYNGGWQWKWGRQQLVFFLPTLFTPTFGASVFTLTELRAPRRYRAAAWHQLSGKTNRFYFLGHHHPVLKEQQKCVKVALCHALGTWETGFKGLLSFKESHLNPRKWTYVQECVLVYNATHICVVMS